jgi:ABC-2 type transport system ATP-binding protein
VTVILTTHDLGDVEKLCERALMIDRGRLLFDGALATLRERFGGERELVVDLDDYEDVSVAGAAVASQGDVSLWRGWPYGQRIDCAGEQPLSPE